MLKKASIITGAVLAGLIALGPLAFAGGHGDDSQFCKKGTDNHRIFNVLNVGGGNFNKCNIVSLPRR